MNIEYIRHSLVYGVLYRNVTLFTVKKERKTYNVRCTLYGVQCTAYIVRRTVYNVHCTLSTVRPGYTRIPQNTV